MSTLTPQSLLSLLRQAVNDYPHLKELMVIRMSIRDLESGKSFGDYSPVESALERIRVDLDKIRYGDTEEFGKFMQLAVDCFFARRSITNANKDTNDGRGSQTALAICNYLECVDLNNARATYSTDGDKIRQYPVLKSVIEHSIVGCRMHGRPHWCPDCHGMNRG